MSRIRILALATLAFVLDTPRDARADGACAG